MLKQCGDFVNTLHLFGFHNLLFYAHLFAQKFKLQERKALLVKLLLTFSLILLKEIVS